MTTTRMLTARLCSSDAASASTMRRGRRYSDHDAAGGAVADGGDDVSGAP
jgi:hypothetical protein